MRKINLLITACIGFLSGVNGQNQPISQTVIPQPNRAYSLSVEHQNDFKSHCDIPITLVVRLKGVFPFNGVVQWTYRHIPCGKTNPVVETVIIPITKGTSALQKKILLKTQNIVTRYDDGSYNVTEIIDPPFTVGGPADIMEGDEATLRVESGSSQENIKWIWFNERKTEVSSGKTYTNKWFNSGTVYVCSEIKGFRSPLKPFQIKVIKRPDAPSDFSITGPSEITDIESATLRIRTVSELRDVRWIWEAGNVKVGEGLSLTVRPERTTTYTVHSEYLWKRSVSRNFQLRLRVLPEAPANFDIIGPDKINEEQTAWLKVSNRDEKNKAIRWIWINTENGTQTVGDSIQVSPKSRTEYELYADLNGKKSPRKRKVIEVIQLAKIPDVSGVFMRCSNSTVPLKFSVRGGQLGTGSDRWAWYEGVCGSGRLVGYGNEVSVSPVKTTRYYVQPENNAAACRVFEVEVGNAPVLPERLTGPEIVCPGESFTIKAAGMKPVDVRWNWERYDEQHKVTSVMGEGEFATDAIENTSRYTVRAENTYCRSKDQRVITVKVRPVSSAPQNVYYTQVKKRKHTLSAANGFLAPGARLVWYRNDCSGTPIGYGTTLSYRAAKSNKLYVRAEGICDTTRCGSLSFTYRREKVKYFFLNAGLNSNFIYESIYGYNASVALGNHFFYLKAKAPVTRIAKDKKEVLQDVGVKLETDNTRITNFPAGASNYYQFNKKFYNESYSATAGIFLGGKVFKLYIGGGYGIRDYYWGADIYTYSQNTKLGSVRAKNTVQSVAGLLAEGGVFLRIGSVNLMGGMSILFGKNSFQYREAFGGIGFNIINKNR